MRYGLGEAVTIYIELYNNIEVHWKGCMATLTI